MSSIGFKKLKHYLSASLLTTIAGIITFPILTRILSKADYGTYSLIQGAQLIYEAILKCGGQLSVLRFYPEMMKGDSVTKNLYLTNALIVPLFFSFLISILFVIGIVLYSLFVEPQFLFILVILSAQASILMSYFHSIMQASGRSKLDAIADILKKYLYLAMVIPIVIYFMSSFWGVYWSICISSLITSVFIVYVNKDFFNGIQVTFNIDYIKKFLLYSFPLFLTEVSAISMSYVDRFVMAALDIPMGEIGLYAIGMGLANVFFMLIWKTIQPLVFPVINDIHDNGDLIGAIKQLSEAANIFVLLSISILVGVYLNCSDFLILLSGNDKVGAGLFFFLGLLVLLTKILGNFLYYGFDLKKETNTMFKSEIIIAILNVVLNLIFIPIFGLYGAVISSLISIPCGFFYKHRKMDLNYKTFGVFNGLPKILLLLLIYAVIHNYLISAYFEMESIKLLGSVIVFATIFWFGRKIWIDKFYRVISVK